MFCVLLSFILFLFLSGCNNAQLSSVKHDRNLYFCAVFEQGGTRLIKSYPISSLREIDNEKKMLLPGYDGLYYKLSVDRNNATVIRGYSIRSNDLIKIEKTDKFGRLQSIEYPQHLIKCIQRYRVPTDKKMIVERSCSNGEKWVEYYDYVKYGSFGGYEKTKSFFYKNNRMLWKLIFKDGISYRYDKNGKLLDKAEDIAVSDLCTPTIQFKANKNVIW